MVEANVTDRKKMIEAMQALFRQIDNIVSANGLLRAVHAIPEGAELQLGSVSNRDSSLGLAIEVLNERLDGIYDALDRVQNAAGIKDPLFGDHSETAGQNEVHHG